MPQQRVPVHGTQSPNYDLPPQQRPAPHTQAPTQEAPAQQQPAQEQQPQQQSQEDRQLADQRQQQCEAAWRSLGIFTLPVVIPGGGRGLLRLSGPWKLDPAPTPTPTPPCGACNETAQKQPIDERVSDLEKRLEEQQKTIDQQQKTIDELQQCTTGDKMSIGITIAGGLLAFGGGLLTLTGVGAPAGLAAVGSGLMILGGGAVTTGAVISGIDCANR